MQIDKLVTQITDADTLPVTLDAVKAHLGIVGSNDDDRLTTLIWAAAEWLELETSRSWNSGETWELAMPTFPCRRIKLPLPPLGEVVSVKYYDQTNTQQTMDPSTYLTFAPTQFDPGEVTPLAGQWWPATYCSVQMTSFLETNFWLNGNWDYWSPISWRRFGDWGRADGVTIRFTTAGVITPLAQTAIMMKVSQMNENREGQDKDSNGLDRLVRKLRMWRYR